MFYIDLEKVVNLQDLSNNCCRKFFYDRLSALLIFHFMISRTCMYTLIIQSRNLQLQFKSFHLFLKERHLNCLTQYYLVFSSGVFLSFTSIYCFSQCRLSRANAKFCTSFWHYVLSHSIWTFAVSPKLIVS